MENRQITLLWRLEKMPEGTKGDVVCEILGDLSEHEKSMIDYAGVAPYSYPDSSAGIISTPTGAAHASATSISRLSIISISTETTHFACLTLAALLEEDFLDVGIVLRPTGTPAHYTYDVISAGMSPEGAVFAQFTIDFKRRIGSSTCRGQLTFFVTGSDPFEQFMT